MSKGRIGSEYAHLPLREPAPGAVWPPPESPADGTESRDGLEQAETIMAEPGLVTHTASEVVVEGDSSDRASKPRPNGRGRSNGNGEGAQSAEATSSDDANGATDGPRPGGAEGAAAPKARKRTTRRKEPTATDTAPPSKSASTSKLADAPDDERAQQTAPAKAGAPGGGGGLGTLFDVDGDYRASRERGTSEQPASRNVFAPKLKPRFNVPTADFGSFRKPPVPQERHEAATRDRVATPEPSARTESGPVEPPLEAYVAPVSPPAASQLDRSLGMLDRLETTQRYVPVTDVRHRKRVSERIADRLARTADRLRGVTSTPGAPRPEDEVRFEHLVSQLLTVTTDRHFSLAVTSSATGEGVTRTCMGLAEAIAHATSRRVVLIDANLRRPAVHWRYGAPPEPGLRDMILEAIELEDDLERVLTDLGNASRVQPTHLPNLSIVPAGQAMEHPSQLLTSEAAELVLRRLFAEYDYVVIDCPPVLTAVDSAVLCRLADGVAMVVRAGLTPREDVERANQRLDGTTIVGVVLNGVTR